MAAFRASTAVATLLLAGAANAACPDVGAQPNLNLTAYAAHRWFIQELMPIKYEPVEFNFCTTAQVCAAPRPRAVDLALPSRRRRDSREVSQSHPASPPAPAPPCPPAWTRARPLANAPEQYTLRSDGGSASQSLRRLVAVALTPLVLVACPASRACACAPLAQLLSATRTATAP